MPQQSSPSLAREEYKYFIPFDKYSCLMQDLQLFMNADLYVPADRGFYLVSSVYFENNQLQVYLTKVNGLAKRYKLRVRSYPESILSSTSLVEIKYKLYDKCLKERATVDQADLTKFLMRNSMGATDFIHPNKTLIHALEYRHRFQLVPFIQIDYRRNAFVGKIDKSIRITFDSNIHCCRYNSRVPMKPNIPVLPGSAILEIKTRGYFPFWLTNIIKKYGLHRSTISKYALSVQRVAINSSMYVR